MRLGRARHLAMAVLSGAFSVSAPARERPDLFRTVRGLAMGGSMTATATGFDALAGDP